MIPDRALMYMPHTPKFSFPALKTGFTTSGGRTYHVPGEHQYESVTSFLARVIPPSATLLEWQTRVGDAAAKAAMLRGSIRGTKVHALVEHYLMTGQDAPGDTMPIHYDMFSQARRRIDKSLQNLWLLEGTMYSHKYQLAGRNDIIGIWDGRLSVIDLKTVTTRQYPDALEKHFTQTAIYARLFESMTGWPYEYPAISQLVIIAASETVGPDAEVFVAAAQPYYDRFEALWQRYGRHRI